MRLDPKEFAQKGLYDASLEHDNCGVGFICNFKGERSHSVVESGIQILLNLEHRGACGSDPCTGDGAGILTQIPDRFFQGQAKKLNVEIPAEGRYAVGMVFFPQDYAERERMQQVFEANVKELGLKFLAWRDVPTNNHGLGQGAIETEPVIKQILIEDPKADQKTFERVLYQVSKYTEHTIENSDDFKEKDFFFIASLSSRTIVYKGLLMTNQLKSYYPDLQDPSFESAIALVHSRFSTNTFPSWDLAHPYRYIAHNGEINTVKGNRNWMATRQSSFESDFFGEDIRKLFPIITPNGSDSFSFDNGLEMLHVMGRTLPHAMMMMIPEAWQNYVGIDPIKKSFYEYHATLMEPWDGPACVCFTDGKMIGATLDRNGLRPARYTVTDDGFLIFASESGVLPIDESKIVQKGRLQPGKMLLADLQEGRIISDEELKAKICAEQPYQEWVKQIIDLSDLPEPKQNPQDTDHETIMTRQKAFGYSDEDLKVILSPMVETSKEPVGSMGTDTPIAVLSDQAPLLFNYFKQQFAQVTNPAIDPIREQLVMSHRIYLGSEGNLLDTKHEHCRRLRLEQPILENKELEQLREIESEGFKSITLKSLFKRSENDQELCQNLRKALNDLFRQADSAVQDGVNLIILSDRGIDHDHIAIPSLLAASGLHQHLIRQGTRSYTSIILETGEARETAHFACLLGFGAEAVNPYLAFESIDSLLQKEKINKAISLSDAHHAYIHAVELGLFKVFSKMGISTLQSYNGAQIFEAIGLAKEFVETYFTGTVSRIEGVGLDVIAKEAHMRHHRAFPDQETSVPKLPVGGDYAFRVKGEFHSWNPESISQLQHAVRQNKYETYRQFSQTINEQNKKVATLRGLMGFKKTSSVPLEEVETASEIVKRFATGAMSFGSISKEAHENLAIAMNRIGGKSNTGEGGEDPERFIVRENGDLARSAIKQVASGRFGVTTHYLVNSDEIQIKISQGAKPGEGGQLPGHKVDRVIAKVRYSTPGVGLISPPPHHDIYSIEDLAQLIHDLKNVNPQARVTVKLVSEAGVGTIAAGVAKAHADMILISGYDGGTGASPLSSIKHAGLPWELGLAETQQILVAQGLRSRTVLQTDGQLKTGRDVVIAALLGAEEYGFATAPLIASGCIMMRKCHLNTCPVGIATQNPELRKRFQGTPEHVVNYFFFIAEEVRELMAELGFRKIDDMIGRSDLLQADQSIHHWKANGIDFGALFYKPKVKDHKEEYQTICQDHGLDKSLDHKILEKCQAAIDSKAKVEMTLDIRNVNRTVGTQMSGKIAKQYGAEGLPDGTIKVNFKGSAGQSFGAFLTNGVQFKVWGDANDYLGKGLFGGRIIVRPPQDAQYVAEDNIVVGNVLLYGAIAGEVFIRGKAGERFAVRNSGAAAVVEGVGDHGCEYMTGGLVIVLGEVGRNFAAGMSGGRAYIWDPKQNFAQKCNPEMVDLEELDSDDQNKLKEMLEKQVEHTDSQVAQRILNDWDNQWQQFVKVMPRDYKRALQELEAEKVA